MIRRKLPSLMLLVALSATAQEPMPPKLTPEETQQLEARAQQLMADGVKQYQSGKPAEALKLLLEELKLRRQLHGEEPHPALANSLNAVGFLLAATGQPVRGLPYYEQALAMTQKLFPASKYPDGHPDLAVSLNNLGGVLQSMGQAEQALPHYRDALAMRQKLFPASKYPDGHPHLAVSLSNLGGVLRSMGQAAQALPHHREALAMQQRLLRRELATASEEAAFDKVNAQPLYRDAYLSITRTAGTSPDEVVAQLWPSRSMVTRLLEQRQANARAAGTELGAKLDELRGLRRRLDQLLQDSKMKPTDRDKLLVVVATERDALERELVAKVPTLQRWQELDKLGPADLVKALPTGAVFLDVIRYTLFEYVEKKQKRSLRYVAFVTVKDRPIQRVELGDAQAIDAALRQWRSAIESRESSPAAETLSRLVWQPLATAIPSGTKTLYLALDGDLTRLPWAALPVGKDRVLLEEYALAQVPHGLFLLDHLKHGKPTTGAESLLALGGIDYGSSNWPALPGTQREVETLAKIAPGAFTPLTKGEVTPAKLKEALATAGYIHFATHGEFNADALTAERQRAAKAMESRLQGDDSRKVAAKNPLGYVGVVLSGGEVLSGLGIVDLPLQQTRLVTLSACETGLGELTGGEGVQGLQRAFHLAGCPNVVASLWKVNDSATAALMAKFYHEMWVNKKPPIEALREAQLTIYRHPERIPALAGERGKPDFTKTVELNPELEANAKGKQATPTKLWAAFVLSGVGR